MSKMSLLTHLTSQGLSKSEINDVVKFREKYAIPGGDKHERIPNPVMFYIGKGLRKAILNIIAGNHIIFEGDKGVGKNTLIDTLGFTFKRPTYEFSINGNLDWSSLVGENTLDVDEHNNTIVRFKEHQLIQAMKDNVGAWFIPDEVNLGRADVLTGMNAVADYRGTISVPGYGIVKAHPAFRILGTMNYGYMGTQELNEAFTDRFVVIHLDPLDPNDMVAALQAIEPDLNDYTAGQLVKLFTDLNTKAKTGAITSRAVTVRGLYQAVSQVKVGLNPIEALESAVVNKAFDSLERDQVRDIVSTLFTEKRDWFDTTSYSTSTGSRVRDEAL